MKFIKELYFKYNNKYTWSIRKDPDGTIYLFFYKTDLSTQHLARLNEDEWENFDGLIIYSTKELNTKEAISSFKELYSILQEKVHGLDKVLDDIIGDF